MALESLCDKQMSRALHLNPQIAAMSSSSSRRNRAIARSKERITFAKTERRIDFMDVKKSLITHPDDAVRGS